jgi:hypothetical protein
MGNDILFQAKGKGTITIHTKMCLRFMRDKLLVSDLKHNLLSMRQLFTLKKKIKGQGIVQRKSEESGLA